MDGMITIEILGTGCDACNELAERVEKAAAKVGVPVSLQRVSDVLDITSYPVAVTPALVIDGTVKCVGSIPSIDEIRDWLRDQQNT